MNATAGPVVEPEQMDEGEAQFYRMVRYAADRLWAAGAAVEHRSRPVRPAVPR